MKCEDARNRLDDLVDGELAPAEADDVSAHLGSCAGCREQERALRALLAEAAALPRELRPERDLWPGIEARLSARPALLRPRPAWRPAALAAAAAVLVALSSAVTWRLASRRERPEQVVVGSGVAATLRPAVAGDTPDLLDAERGYARATSDLLAALAARRGSLPTETLDAVERNMKVIDEALASLRVALASDPGNPELTQLLAATHKRKLDTLRRVVRLSRI